MSDRLQATAAAVHGVALCWRCVADKANIPPADIDAALTELENKSPVAMMLDECEGCHRNTMVYLID